MIAQKLEIEILLSDLNESDDLFRGLICDKIYDWLEENKGDDQTYFDEEYEIVYTSLRLDENHKGCFYFDIVFKYEIIEEPNDNYDDPHGYGAPY